MRRHQVLRRPLEGADEGGRHPVRTRLDEDGIRPEVHAVGIGDMHPAVDVEQRDALAVDRDLDPLGLFGRVQRALAVPEQGAGRLVVEGDAEDVLPVRREVVVHR
ncbi:MAG: hypothetical protein F4Z33_04880, partial [Gemmatimonadales bacterium]|nr:hypothetical protein [Gemmatimonadales bacterium]